jgi:CubicO group peptidase (beta-lactamase class C family)
MPRFSAFSLAVYLIASSAIAQSPDVAAAPHGRLAGVLQSAVDRHVISGGVLVVTDKEKVLDVDAVGLADIAGGKPMRDDTLFWIASQSKSITAAAVMMLVDEGKVRIDDPVEKYLPEFKGQMVKTESDASHALLVKPVRPICIRDLLSHTSGLPMVSPVERPALDLLPLQNAVASYAMCNLQFQPGTKMQYANAGFNTAGRIIEVVSGMPYEDFMQKRLFDPLGMKDTTFWPTQEQLTRLALSYESSAPPAPNVLKQIPIGQLTYPLDDRVHRFPMPAGGLFSTGPDIARFCRMIVNLGVLDGHRYLSEAAVREMTMRQTGPLLQDKHYGFGWWLDGGIWDHAGAYQSNMAIDPRTGLCMVYMVNHAGYVRDVQGTRSLFQKTAEEQFAPKGAATATR